MADPFSIVVGIVGLADVCSRIIKNLDHIRQDMGTVDEDLETLVQEVGGLRDICETVRATFGAKSDDATTSEFSKVSEATEKVWQDLERALQNCHGVILKLDEIVQEIRGPPGASGSGKLDAFRKSLRKRFRDSDLQRCRAQLATYQNALQLVLTIITFLGISSSENSNTRSFKELFVNVQNLDKSLQTQIANLQAWNLNVSSGLQYDASALVALKQLQESVTFAALAIKEVSSNHHFDVPQSVSSIFTGRDAQLNELRRILIPSRGKARDQYQRRFIVHGLGGSGKTQFCCKFAEENRDFFWGIFWIDASTPERFKQTLGNIADIGGVDKTENAAFHWLSNLERTWLLIIDNADDVNVPLEKYFPKGNRGSILVTTRNPAYKVHGNVGPGFYEFRGLDFDEAIHLLLRASGEPTPWDAACEALALSISKALGFLALAIIHAGAAIRDKLCNLKDYMDYYSRSWQRLRIAKAVKNVSETDATVYTTWEICYNRLEERKTVAASDALQLLNILAFFHWEDISQEIFIRAVRNAELELEQEHQTTAPDASSAISQRSDFKTQIRAIPAAFIAWVLKNRSPPPLPAVIRDGRQPGGADDAVDRIRFALKELTQISLVIRNDYNNTYSLHPIVHIWARERPKMSGGDQALWADAAGMILSLSILLPPLGMSESDERYHLSLLPHIKHVQARREVNSQRLARKARSSQVPFSVWIGRLFPPLTPDADRMRMYAKFSLVYAKCGDWDSAEQRLKEVRDFLYRYLGPEHKRSRQVALFLSTIYWNQGDPIKAAKLQTQVMKTCQEHLGVSHPDTLKAMAELGRTRWQQGQFTAARQLQEKVLAEMTRTLPPDHEDIFDAMDNLGLTIQKFWGEHHFQEAYRLHEGAMNGMARIYGDHHERTLIAKENMCRVAALLGGPDVNKAAKIMKNVLETRQVKLGKEHPYTLLAMINTAILLSATGRPSEAEELILEGLPIADRNLGRDHIGTLFGRHTLACVLAQQNRFAEAEALLVHVTDSQKRMTSHRGDYHPDRLVALIELARCHFMQGKTELAISVCDVAIHGFEIISSSPHPLANSLRLARASMQNLLQHESQEPQSLNAPHAQHGVSFPFVLFRSAD